MNPRQRALDLLCLCDPVAKALQTRALYAELDAQAIAPGERFEAPPLLPGRPALPRLVPPKEVPTRSPFTTEGRAALLHAVTHIEFNAIKGFIMKAIQLDHGGAEWHKPSATRVFQARNRQAVTPFVGRRCLPKAIAIATV